MIHKTLTSPWLLACYLFDFTLRFLACLLYFSYLTCFPFPIPDTLCLRAFACAVFFACNIFLPGIYTVHFLGLGLGPYLKQTNMPTNKPSCLASLFY